MKVSELPKGTNMGQVRVRTFDGQEGWWHSQWTRGIWLTDIHPEETGSRKLNPVFVKDLKECLDWEVLEVLDHESKSV